MRSFIKINSIDEFDKAIDQNHHRFFIKNSSGRINEEFTIFLALREGYYEIYNHHKDIDQILSSEQLFDKEYSNIGEEIKNGNFYTEI